MSSFAVWDSLKPQGFNRNGSDFQLFDSCACFRCLVLHHLIVICAPNFIANSKLAFEFKKSCPITKKTLANTHFTYWVSWTAFDTSGPSFGVEQSPVMNFWKHSGKPHLNLRNNKHLLRVGHSFLSTATAGASLRWGEARPGNSMKNEICTIFNYFWNKLLPFGDQIATMLLASGGFLVDRYGYLPHSSRPIYFMEQEGWKLGKVGRKPEIWIKHASVCLSQHQNENPLF